MEFDHGRNLGKNFSEISPKCFDRSAKTRGIAHLVEKFLAGNQPGFIANQQIRLAEIISHRLRRKFSVLADSAGSDGEVKIQKDFAEIEYDGFGNHGIRN